MQQMQQGEGQGNEQAGGQEDPFGEPRGNQQAGPRDMDPLGRPTRNRDYSDGGVEVPGPGGAAQRAQRILEELRRKLGDPMRAQEELEYFERLLRRN
jgi:hypothetical protein